MINFKDIVNSWITSVKPSEDELSRAEERYEICNGCEFKKELFENQAWSVVCSACGCPISKKIYSSVINPCPKNKWQEVDKKYQNLPIIKDTKTII